MKTKPTFRIEDGLADFTADLLTKHESVIARLLSCPAGHWVYVDELVETDDALIDSIDALQDAGELELLVMWVDYSEVMDQDGFVSIVFYADGQGWSSVAVYNKQLLDAKQRTDVGN